MGGKQRRVAGPCATKLLKLLDLLRVRGASDDLDVVIDLQRKTIGIDHGQQFAGLSLAHEYSEVDLPDQFHQAASPHDQVKFQFPTLAYQSALNQ